MIIVDTGPIVALLRQRDKYHEWAKEQFKTLSFPFISCLPVLTEATFILGSNKSDLEKLYLLRREGAIQIEPHFSGNDLERIEALILKYHSRPMMSYADACLVRIAELRPKSQILTIDSDFTVYRKHRNQTIDIVMPS